MQSTLIWDSPAETVKRPLDTLLRAALLVAIGLLAAACVSVLSAPKLDRAVLPPPAAAPAAKPHVEASPTPISARALVVPSATPRAHPEVLDPLPVGIGDVVPQVTMDIVLNHLDRRLRVTQNVRFANDATEAWHEVVFAVPPAHLAGVFRLDQVEITTMQRHRMAHATLDGIMLHVALPEPVLPGEPVGITLSYTMRIPHIDPDDRLPEGNLGAGERVIQAGDWHPTLVPYRTGEGWQTWSYHAVGDPFVYPVADYDVQIFAAPDLIVAAPGLVSDDGHVRRYAISDARSFAFFASPDYLTETGSALGLPLRSYYLPGNARAARATLDTAARAIELFDELYGPYPVRELVIVQNAYVGSMEYSGLISLSTEAYASYVENPAAHLVVLTVHETAHQWWYGAVGNDQVHEPWLDEAFAKYSEQLFYERYAPDLVPWWWETHVYRYDPHGTLDRTIYDFDATVTYFNQLYGQAARFLGDLRTQMGDQAFFAFVRSYGEFGKGELMTGADFLEHLLAATDEDLRPIIDRYFETVPLD